MASPVVARWQIWLGDFVTTEIRVWEFLNYYTFGCGAAAPDHVAMIPDVRVADELQGGNYAMQIGARSHKDPITYQPRSDSVTATVDDLLLGTGTDMRKGDAIVDYALALEEIQSLMYTPSKYPQILEIIDETRQQVLTAADALGDDPELVEIGDLLLEYRTNFE
ncbi:MAG: hypothetical protein R6V85_07125 [Polyangia bacterium]